MMAWRQQNDLFQALQATVYGGNNWFLDQVL